MIDRDVRSSYQYGALAYSSMNIGDEIQTLAALRYLPRVDHWIHREQVGSFTSDIPTKLILNAWWMWKPERFPPSSSIKPLPISMHIRPDIAGEFLRPETRAWLLEHGPIGCRDLGTLELLEKNSIPSYHSGCLTLTLQPDPGLQKQDYILCVDVPKEVVKRLRQVSDVPVHLTSQVLTPYLSQKNRREVARAALALFQMASAVVSTRLHAILPSIALGTPALRLETGTEQLDAAARYSGTDEYVHSTPVQEFLEDPSVLDQVLTAERSQRLTEIQKDLVARCSEFTGYDHQIHDSKPGVDPAIRLLQAMRRDRKVVTPSLYHASSRELAKAAFMRRVRGRTKHDL